MKRDDEPKLWVTVLKLLLLGTCIIGGVAAALLYAAKLEQRKTGAPSAGDGGWGIVTDSPVRPKR
jgi:hypothetical protein